MTQDEVRAMLGDPHNRDGEEEGETWYYHCDALGFGILRIRFDRERRVEFDWW